MLSKPFAIVLAEREVEDEITQMNFFIFPQKLIKMRNGENTVVYKSENVAHINLFPFFSYHFPFDLVDGELFSTFFFHKLTLDLTINMHSEILLLLKEMKHFCKLAQES